MTHRLTLGLVLVLVACDSDVKSHYLTVEDARRDGLLERGWLPDVLPPSARDIDVSNNLDINTSTGSFKFNPAEYQLLVSKLRLKTAATKDRDAYRQYEY